MEAYHLCQIVAEEHRAAAPFSLGTKGIAVVSWLLVRHSRSVTTVATEGRDAEHTLLSGGHDGQLGDVSELPVARYIPRSVKHLECRPTDLGWSLASGQASTSRAAGTASSSDAQRQEHVLRVKA